MDRGGEGGESRMKLIDEQSIFSESLALSSQSLSFFQLLDGSPVTNSAEQLKSINIFYL